MEQIAKASVSDWQIADLLKKLGADEEAAALWVGVGAPKEGGNLTS